MAIKPTKTEKRMTSLRQQYPALRMLLPSAGEYRNMSSNDKRKYQGAIRKYNNIMNMRRNSNFKRLERAKWADELRSLPHALKPENINALNNLDFVSQAVTNKKDYIAKKERSLRGHKDKLEKIKNQQYGFKSGSRPNKTKSVDMFADLDYSDNLFSKQKINYGNMNDTALSDMVGGQEVYGEVTDISGRAIGAITRGGVSPDVTYYEDIARQSDMDTDEVRTMLLRLHGFMK